jgi:hypothetical protein
MLTLHKLRSIQKFAIHQADSECPTINNTISIKILYSNYSPSSIHEYAPPGTVGPLVIVVTDGRRPRTNFYLGLLMTVR